MTRFSLFFPPTFVLSIFSCFTIFQMSIWHWYCRNTFPLPNLGLKRNVSNVYLLHIKRFRHTTVRCKASVCKPSSWEKEGRKELVWRGVVRFFWNGLPHKPGFHQTIFCSTKSYCKYSKYWYSNISCRASLYVCVCVFWRCYVVYKLVGFPPELVYPPSSPLVCNCQCLTQLVTRPCLVLSC